MTLLLDNRLVAIGADSPQTKVFYTSERRLRCCVVFFGWKVPCFWVLLLCWVRC